MRHVLLAGDGSVPLSISRTPRAHAIVCSVAPATAQLCLNWHGAHGDDTFCPRGSRCCCVLHLVQRRWKCSTGCAQMLLLQ